MEKFNPLSFEIDFSVQTQATYFVTVTYSYSNTVEAELDAENLSTIIHAVTPILQDETTVLENLMTNGGFEDADFVDAQRSRTIFLASLEVGLSLNGCRMFAKMSPNLKLLRARARFLQRSYLTVEINSRDHPTMV